MTTRIVRVGSTLSVEIPEELVVQAALPVGEPVEWVVEWKRRYCAGEVCRKIARNSSNAHDA
jgi:antitoxin component of MazEF toxin-antitoxin module